MRLGESVGADEVERLAARRLWRTWIFAVVPLALFYLFMFAMRGFSGVAVGALLVAAILSFAI